MPEKLSHGPRTAYDARVGAGLSRGPSMRKKLNAAPWSGTWPSPSATLDLDFANDRGFVRGVGQGRSMDAVTFTRASVGRFVDQDGLLQEAANNEPRFDWASTDSTGAGTIADPRVIPLRANPTSNGLLIEEARTNRLLWNRDANFGPARNLLARSEEFDNAYWTKTNVTISADATTDPLGGNTADKVIPSTTGTNRSVSRGIVSSGILGVDYTTSIYAKKGEYDWIYLYEVQGNRFAYFDINTGVVGTVSSGATAAIENIGSGWYRCSVKSQKTTTSSTSIFFGPCDADNSTSVTASGTNGTFFWGAQIEFASSASAYEQTTNSGSIWSRQSITAAKDQTGIDGVTNAASSLTSTADNGTCIQTITLASGSRSGSVFLKRITGTGNVQVSLDGSTWSTVDLSDTEWRRIVLSGTVTNPTVGIRLLVSGDAVAMDYGQVEDGAFPTSPILTTTASVTRAVDASSMLGQKLLGWYDLAGGTVYVEAGKAPSTANARYINFNLTSSGVSSGIIDLFQASGGLTSYITNYGQVSEQVNFAQSTTNISNIRAAFRFSTNNSGTSLNGSAVTNDFGCILPTNLVALNIGYYIVAGFSLNNSIKRIVYFPKRISNDGLIEMTK
jgi:hypothetical protein